MYYAGQLSCQTDKHSKSNPTDGSKNVEHNAALFVISDPFALPLEEETKECPAASLSSPATKRKRIES